MPIIRTDVHQSVKVGDTLVKFVNGEAEVSQEVADILLSFPTKEYQITGSTSNKEEEEEEDEEEEEPASSKENQQGMFNPAAAKPKPASSSRDWKGKRR